VQVFIALVVTPEGLPLFYEMFPGNTADKTTLRGKPERIEARLFVAFLANCLSSTLRQQLRKIAIGLMPRSVFRKTRDREDAGFRRADHRRA